jgi:peptidyl-prolyl cis-trans isomerase B (cyclophilin B)
MNVVTAAMVVWSVLVPAKVWFAPNQPVSINVQPEQGTGPVALVLTDFTGKPFDPRGPAVVDGAQTIDLRNVFAQATLPGTYVLWAVRKPETGPPTALDLEHFLGTPLVIEVRADTRRDAPPGPMVIKVEPLRYAVISTAHGDMTCAFYYDDAPNTVAAFLSLADGGFYDGLTFHRIVPNFVLQGGDPKGDGTGGPGVHLEAEFNDRPHQEGVLSMARQGDPIERQGAMPRCEYANSAGSQFFVCLNYDATKQLDGRYTAFGRVVDGMDVVRKIAAIPVGGPNGDRPENPPVMQRIQVLPVRPGKNPYSQMMSFVRQLAPKTIEPASEPTTAPSP